MRRKLGDSSQENNNSAGGRREVVRPRQGKWGSRRLVVAFVTKGLGSEAVRRSGGFGNGSSTKLESPSGLNWGDSGQEGSLKARTACGRIDQFPGLNAMHSCHSRARQRLPHRVPRTRHLRPEAAMRTSKVTR
jgi:hypothetical protein